MGPWLHRSASDQADVGRTPSDVGRTPSDTMGSLAAEDVLRDLLPDVLPSVYLRLRREGINTATDLVGLDKGDLRELGFTMLERSRLLQWSRDTPMSALAEGQTPAKTATWVPTPTNLAGAGIEEESFAIPAISEMVGPTTPELVEAQHRLDEIEQQADFWCSLVSAQQHRELALQMPQVSDHDGKSPKSWHLLRMRSNSFSEEVGDLRENVLEGLFDLTSERVSQMYSRMRGRSEDNTVTLDALRFGLHRCGLPELEDAKLTKIVEAVSKARRVHGRAKTAASRGVSLIEFEAMLSRLKLAQLLTAACPLPVDPETLGGRRVVLGSAHVSGRLLAVDYNTQTASVAHVHPANVREFFFGHRRRPRAATDMPLVRWVHMPGLDLNLLLALTVKYSLHPLGVEDVIEQCPTKVDRYGSHYFAAVEQLILASPVDGSEPVRVHGRHVALFCSGPPLFDTLVTVTEPDHDEKEDWPGGASREAQSVGDAWVERLRERLEAAHSRLRERRADFLMYQVLDLSVDELVKVTRAYTTRLSILEEQPHITPSGLVSGWLQEVQLAQQQLSVVARRLRGLQRLIRRIIEDPDVTAGLAGYVNDVRDHINEAREDAAYLSEKCRSLLETSERLLERHHNICRQRADDRLNQMVFVLTVATAIFAPVQFLAGVYGMNFVYVGGPLDGKPSIPELRWTYGYEYFWAVVIAYLAVSITTAVLVQRCVRWKRREDLDKSVALYASNKQLIVGAGSARVLHNADGVPRGALAVSQPVSSGLGASAAPREGLKAPLIGADHGRSP